MKCLKTHQNRGGGWGEQGEGQGDGRGGRVRSNPYKRQT